MRFDNLTGLDPKAGQPTPRGQMQPQAALVLAEESYRLLVIFPCEGHDRAQPTLQVFDKASAMGDVFFAWLGRARLSLAFKR